MDALLHTIDDNALRAEVREFARRPQDEQLVQLYLELKARNAPSKPLKERLYEFGYIGAFIAYALFDNKDSLPPMGGR